MCRVPPPPASRIAAALAACALACALAGAPRGARAEARPTLAVPQAASPIVVDGVLDEPAWGAAPAVTAFRLLAPREDEAPDESTCVRVLEDGDRLVIGIWCGTRRPLRASLVPRDQITDGDHVAVHLDTDGDGQRAYIFGVNPYGVELDGILTGVDPDFKWDGVWSAAAHRGTDAWTAEIAVPFRVLRISARERPWRIWLRREIPAWNEAAAWPPYRAGIAGPIMLQAADLTGLEGARGARDLELEPYAFAARTGVRAPALDGTLPDWAQGAKSEAGVDAQVSLTRSLALNATFNPDFSQIEADALQIDLNQRFPLQFPEKRPFFLEGAERFATPLELFYSRRLGDPHWGFKLAGRAGAWNAGALVVRDHGGAPLDGSGYGATGVARPGLFTLARAQLPFGDGSNIGVMAGSHTQDAPAELPADGLFHETRTLNELAGLDSQLKLSDRWTFEGQLATTHSRVDSARTDGAATRAAYDGAIGVARLHYRDRARSAQLGWRHVAPNYRDDLGYEQRLGVDYRSLDAFWDLFPSRGALQRVSPQFSGLLIHDRDGRIELVDLEPTLEVAFRRSVWANAGLWHLDERWLGRVYPQERAHAYFEDDRWRPLTWSLEAWVGDGIFYGPDDASSFLAWTETYALSATARPRTWLTAAVNVQRLRVAHRPRGGDAIDLWLGGVNTTAQFTRRLYLRIYPQVASDTRHLDADGLLGYVLSPGSVLYLGANSGWDPVLGRRRATSRTFFAKVSYRFAL